MTEKAIIPSDQFTENSSAFSEGKHIDLREDAGCIDIQLDEVFGEAVLGVRFAVESYGIIDPIYRETTKCLRLFIGNYAQAGQTTQIVIRAESDDGKSAVVTFKVTVWPSRTYRLISA